VVHPAVNAPEQVRAVLTAAARDAAEQLAAITRQLASVVEASAGDEHDPEGATIAFERAQLGFLREQAVTRGNEIDLALARLEAGSYGVCVRCGNPISRERLDARPASATCIACASR
jgi:RNA polymerase-binding transcription factor DksA